MATYKLEIKQGTSVDRLFYWRDSNQVGINMTGYTGRMQIRPSAKSEEIQADLTTANGGIVLGADGSFRIIMTDAQTSAITIRSGAYDLEVVAPGTNKVTRLLEGQVLISPEVTR